MHVRVHVLALSSATNCVQPGTGTRPALEGSKSWGQDMERGRMRGGGGGGGGVVGEGQMRSIQCQVAVAV